MTPDNKTQSALEICVFCGSSPGKNPAHMILARQLGTEISARGHRLVYGGGGVGLMGETARATHNGGGKVIGIIPDFLKNAERSLPAIKHEIVKTMHSRKHRMFSLADAFIVLPGGIGTLEEVTEVLSWLRLNLHDKPIIFLSDTGYWDPFVDVLKYMIAEGFAPDSLACDIEVATSVKDAFERIKTRLEQPRIAHDLKLS